MTDDLEILKITKEELERLINLDIKTSLALEAYQAFASKKLAPILSFLMTEFFTFGLILIFVMPISAILLRNPGALADTAKTNQILIALLGLCLSIFICGNLYLGKNIRKIKTLAHLFSKIEKYNNVIQAIKFVDQLEVAKQSEINQRKELIAALKVTKESLLCALKVEEVLRQHRELIHQRYELLANLESNLTALMVFDVSHPRNDYAHLLQDAIAIGITVQKEVRILNSQV
jgi:hypothetical protein